MKKLLLMLLIIPSIMIAQERGNFNISLNTDGVIVTDNKPSIGIEAELDMKYIYTKIGVENTFLDLNYFDVHVGIGGSIPLNDLRIYGGIRVGLITREDKVKTNPFFGLESGVQYKLSNRFHVKAYVTYDERREGEFLGWDNYWQASGKIGIVYIIKNL